MAMRMDTRRLTGEAAAGFTVREPGGGYPSERLLFGTTC